MHHLSRFPHLPRSSRFTCRTKRAKTQYLAQRLDNGGTHFSSQSNGERRCRRGSESVESGGGSHEASIAPDLITSDRSFISQLLCSQQPGQSSEDTVQTPQRRQTVAVRAASTQDSRRKCQIYKHTNTIKMRAVIHSWYTHVNNN